MTRHLSCIAILSLSLALSACQSPPESSLEEARAALKSASAARAFHYAEEPYREAEALLQSGWQEISLQQSRLWFLRDYSKADSLLKRSSDLAREAAQKAAELVRELEASANRSYTELSDELTHWREALDGTLVLYKAEKYWTLSLLGLQSAQQLIAAGEFEAAIMEIDSSRQKLSQLSRLLDDYQNDETNELPVWRRWVEKTLAEAEKKKTYGIVVDKTAHEIHLFKGQQLVRTYSCDLGYNSAYQKQFAGDGATPEGVYHVVSVKHGNSKYYKALLLDYPNAADVKRFKETKRKGLISPRAKIGKLIEIHGDGGLDKDWTDGCVAVSNNDMDHLMQFVNVGTPVTIVRRWDGKK
ncbi:L,D-transpeptidase [bacterium]|nr:L,D-transpeptidase [bacterium]